MEISTDFCWYFQKKFVDIVDNLDSKYGFADFMHISGTHSYQQVAVDTIF